MSSIANSEFDSSNNDELVAYLDGELPPAECRAVEARLANDDAYRQQLRDLDQAWEALDTLPPATVDDSFARTTIELACVQAEEDLTQQKSLATVETRSRKRWWIAGGVAAAVVSFLMVRALAVHRNNMLLADLPAIQEAAVLSHVESIEFLRQLAKEVPLSDLKREKDDVAFQRELENFRQANSASLAERRQWIESLSQEEKAVIADRARAFEDRRQSPANRIDKDRLRQLVIEIQREPALEETLIAFGHWLANNPDEQSLPDKLQGLAVAEQVSEVRKEVQRKNEQAARHLSPTDATSLRNEIIALAKEKHPEVLKNIPPGRVHDRVERLDVSKPQEASWVLFLLMRDPETHDATVKRLISKLSPEAQSHWNELTSHSRHERDVVPQLLRWEDDALHPQWGASELEQFFVNKLSNDERQKLLDSPRSEMKSRLEHMYENAELGIDTRIQQFRDFRDFQRGMRGGPGGGSPEMERPGERGPRFGPRPQDDPRFDRDLPSGPGGPPGTGPDDRRENGRPGRRPPPRFDDDGPPGGPPAQQPSPPPEREDKRPI
jgi:hypothetical protein